MSPWPGNLGINPYRVWVINEFYALRQPKTFTLAFRHQNPDSSRFGLALALVDTFGNFRDIVARMFPRKLAIQFSGKNYFQRYGYALA